MVEISMRLFRVEFEKFIWTHRSRYPIGIWAADGGDVEASKYVFSSISYPYN